MFRPTPRGNLATQTVFFADLQAAYPNVDYQFDLMGGTMGPLSVTVSYAGNAYSNTPQLAAASFDALQGLNAANSITLDFNSMEVSPNARRRQLDHFFDHSTRRT